VFSPNALQKAIEHNIDLVFHDVEQLALLDSVSLLENRSEKTLNIWLKINTGMNRLGFDLEQIPVVLEKLASYSFVTIEVLMTHFANADSGEKQHQLKALEKFEQA